MHKSFQLQKAETDTQILLHQLLRALLQVLLPKRLKISIKLNILGNTRN